MANETTQAHTPGEYIASPRGEGDDWDIWTVAPEILLATVYGDFDVTAAEGKANARLMAAAPELYSSLRNLLQAISELPLPKMNGLESFNYGVCVGLAKEAIAKASQVHQE